nr:nitric oxide synthase-interacting protein [Quercus suber]
MSGSSSLRDVSEGALVLDHGVVYIHAHMYLKEILQAMTLSTVQSVQESSTEEADHADVDGRCDAPWQRRLIWSLLCRHGIAINQRGQARSLAEEVDGIVQGKTRANTSLAFFTAHEREEVKGHWGSRSTRLTRDSFLPFGSCQLCLLPARDPVSCPSHGHIFCRECAISNLLAQSKELKRLRKEAERRKLEDEEEKDLNDAEAQARALEQFERIQAGLSARPGAVEGERIVDRQNGKITIEQETPNGGRGTKRKFELDEAEVLRLSNGDDAKKVKNVNNELPSFWVPSQTPGNKKADLKAVKAQPTCPAAATADTHEFMLKTLVSVHFHGESSRPDAEVASRTCPSCDKALSNSTKAILAKPCGHVVCKPCSDKFQQAAEKSAHDIEHDEMVRCYVCQEDVTPRQRLKRKKDGDESGKKKQSDIDRGLVELCSDGTGFAGGGKNMVKKLGVAFQC